MKRTRGVEGISVLRPTDVPEGFLDQCWCWISVWTGTEENSTWTGFDFVFPPEAHVESWSRDGIRLWIWPMTSHLPDCVFQSGTPVAVTV